MAGAVKGEREGEGREGGTLFGHTTTLSIYTEKMSMDKTYPHAGIVYVTQLDSQNGNK